ncbi:hypothetical protein TRVL_04024 [Trypanosoma vivax]|nr:hypothetical protein TRVL_04024 [Trypanosoma vivax]
MRRDKTCTKAPPRSRRRSCGLHKAEFDGAPRHAGRRRPLRQHCKLAPSESLRLPAGKRKTWAKATPREQRDGLGDGRKCNRQHDAARRATPTGGEAIRHVQPQESRDREDTLRRGWGDTAPMAGQHSRARGQWARGGEWVGFAAKERERTDTHRVSQLGWRTARNPAEKNQTAPHLRKHTRRRRMKAAKDRRDRPSRRTDRLLEAPCAPWVATSRRSADGRRQDNELKRENSAVAGPRCQRVEGREGRR